MELICQPVSQVSASIRDWFGFMLFSGIATDCTSIGALDAYANHCVNRSGSVIVFDCKLQSYTADDVGVILTRDNTAMSL